MKRLLSLLLPLVPFIGLAQTAATVERFTDDGRQAGLIANSVQAVKIPERLTTLTPLSGHPRDHAQRALLQTVIDSISAIGGGAVILHAGEYFMDGPLEMKSHVRLHLKDGATLLFSSALC